MATLDELLVRIGIQDDTEEGAAAVERNLGRAAAGAGIAGAAVGMAFAAGISSAMDISAARGKLSAELDLTTQQAAQANDALSAVFESGLVASMDEARMGVQSVMSSMEGMKNASAADIAQVTKEAQVLANKLEVDVGEAANVAGSMVKNGLVKTSKEGLDLLTAAAPLFPQAMRGELPEVINEFGDGFAKIGLNGQQSMGLLKQAVDGGAMSIEEAADIMNEFARIATEEPKRAAEAFKELQLPAQKTLDAIQSGGPKGAKALGQITEALRGYEGEMTKAQLITQIFGDRAGDSTEAVLALNPETAAAAGKLDEFAGAAKRAADAAEGNPAAQLQSTMNILKNTLGEAFLGPLKKLGDFLKENKEIIKAMVVPALIILTVIFLALTAATLAWGAAIMMTPVGWIMAAIVAVIAVIVLIIFYWDEIVAATKRAWAAVVAYLGIAWNWIKAKVLGVWNWITSKISGSWQAIKDYVRAGIDWVSSKISGGMDWVERKVNGVIDAVVGYFSRLKDGAIRRARSLINWIQGLPGRLKRGLGDLAGLLKSAGKDLIRGLINGVRDMAWRVVSAARDVVGGAIDGAKRLLGIASPSKVFTDIGEDTGAGLVLGLGASKLRVTRAARELAAGVIAPFEQVKPAVRDGMRAAMGELEHLVSSGAWTRQGSKLFEDISFQGMSENFGQHQREIADGFWDAVNEIKAAVKSGERVFEDMTFKGMSDNVKQFHDVIAQIWRGNPWGTTFGDFGRWAPQGADLPRLADGGITTGPTVAMIGEGGEREVVQPLSHLEHLLGSSARTAPSVMKVQPATVHSTVHLDVTGADEGMKELIRSLMRTDNLLGNAEAG